MTITGVLNGNSGTLEVAGDWDNTGTFNAGTSTVQMVDGCGLSSAVIAGETTFANLDMTTMTGFLYSFVAGLTQTVTNSLTLLGEEGSLLTLRSTLAEMDAFVDVQGSSSSDFVDVEDVVIVPEPDPTLLSLVAIGTILLVAGFQRGRRAR